MERVLIFSKDYVFTNNMMNCLDKSYYLAFEGNEEVSGAFTECLRSNASVIIIHSSYIRGNFLLFQQLLATKKFKVIYVTTSSEIGALYQVIDNPRFYFLQEYRYSCINEILNVMEKANVQLQKLEVEIEFYKDKIEEEKLIKKAKLLLIRNGYQEDAAYQYILKTAMNQRISKKMVAQKILEEGED